MKILAIESSCDETSAAVVCDDTKAENRILSNVIHSQIEIHKKYGGVIPEIAARDHVSFIDKVILDALDQSKTNLAQIDCIAATAGPGLIGGLLVGMVSAKTLAWANSKPFMAINHLEGHILTSRLCNENLEFPYLLILTSGGNFLFVEVLGVGNYKVLGQTIDDAAGEAFDKVAKMLGLDYPGGPSIQKVAEFGDPSKFTFTIPLQKRDGCDVSFSGLKTAVRTKIASISNISEQDICDIAASFQQTSVKFIIKQLSKAIKISSYKHDKIVIAGGVAANKLLRSQLVDFCENHALSFYAPPIFLCGDNAAMIAWAAIEKIKNNQEYSDLSFKTQPRWQIT